ncbi:MAG TPA: TonB-dependent receptor [Gemmatimonadales bacterium]|nr:TonB-dependent receptor [Gemmatimonadales bacterium]
MRRASLGVVLAALLVVPGGLQGQSGSITGTITGRTSGQPLQGVDVAVLVGGQATSRVSTGADGRFRVAGVAPGTYVVEVRRVGYQFGRVGNVVVAAGGTATVDLQLTESVIQLDAIVVTVGRAPEKQLEAPASVHVIQEVDVRERPALTVIDQLKNVPGVDVSQGGLVQSNVVGRGFNNIFSGSTLMLVDNRFASVPSLRVNVPAFFSSTSEDMEQMEFVLGPGAALYGPNSAKGVLAITTKSPLTSQGSTLWFESGFRAGSRDAAGNSLDDPQPIWRAGGRFAVADERVGFKISGEYLKATDWLYRDPAEPLQLPLRLGPTHCDTIFGCRNFNLEKWNADARVDVKTGDDSELILAAGNNQAINLIEPTGIGAGMVGDWRYSYAQTRFRLGRLFLQAFGNFSNAGNTFLLRTGQPIVDYSRVYAVQGQYGFDLGTRGTILVGGDYVQTVPRTNSTINGRNEADDNITEVGGYVHSITRLTDQLELIAALRVDDHSRLEDLNISPRGALVFKPTETQNIRFTYNRAFATPTTNNLFLDIVAGTIPGTPFRVRALGVPQGGFSFRGYCGAGGVDDLCARSGWPGAPTTAFPAQAAPLWPVAREAVIARLTAAALGPLAPFQTPIVNALRALTTPTPAQVGTQLRTLDPTAGVFNDATAATVADVTQMEPEITQVFEIGYKGILGDKVRLSVDGWLEKKKNFIGPLIVESPNMFLDLNSLAAYLTANYPPALVAQGLTPAQAATVAAALIPTIAGGAAGLSGSTTAPGVPLGTVVPNHALTDTGDMFLTYRNFGNVDLWGADLAIDYILNDQWSLSGTYSHVSDDYFAAADVNGPTDVALNASKSKFSAGVKYRQGGEQGFSGEARVRYTKGFPINSGVYVTALTGTTRTSIDNYTVVDTQLSYRFAFGLLAAVTAQNLLNTNYAAFVGVPQLGRVVLTKLQYAY